MGRFKYLYLNALPLQEVTDRWIEPLLTCPDVRTMRNPKQQLQGQSIAKPDFIMQSCIRCAQDVLTGVEAAPNFPFQGRPRRMGGNTFTYIAQGRMVMLICIETALAPNAGGPLRLAVTLPPAGPALSPLDAARPSRQYPTTRNRAHRRRRTDEELGR